MTEIVLQGFKDQDIQDDKNVLDVLFEWRNDPRIYQWCRQECPISWRHHKEYWENVQLSFHDKMFLVYERTKKESSIKLMDHGEVVTLKERFAHRLVGVAGLTNIDWQGRHGEFSLYIDPDSHRHGFARQALLALLKIGFDDLGLNKIWGETFSDNPARFLFDKMGMKSNKGHTAHYFRHGKFIDTLFYYMTADDWRNVNEISS